MKMALVLMSVFMLILLTCPSEAKQVYFALVSADVFNTVPAKVDSTDAVDAIIRNNSQDIDHYFQNGDLTLQLNEELIIRGGRGSIKAELDRYKGRNIILNTSGIKDKVLHAYGCYIKRPFPRENTTYIMVRANNWVGREGCTRRLDKSTGRTIFLPILDLSSLSAWVAAIPKN